VNNFIKIIVIMIFAASYSFAAKMNLNKVTAQELINSGINIDKSVIAYIIDYRDSVGGLQNIYDVFQIPGLTNPEQIYMELKNNTFIPDISTLVGQSTASTVYTFFPGDELEIVAEDEILSTLVQPDGRIYLPGIGFIQAKGLTPEELTAIINNKTGMVVYISLKKVSSKKIYVWGNASCVNAGIYNYGLLTEILAEAGGIQKGGNYKIVIMYPTNQKKTVDIRKLRGGEAKLNEFVPPGSSLYVQQHKTWAFMERVSPYMTILRDIVIIVAFVGLL